MTLDSEDEDAFLLHISEGHVIKFIRGPLPFLYYFDAGNIHMSKLKLAFSFLNTVSENKKIFKNREVQKATDSVMLNRKTSHISKDKFVRTLKYNWIRNNPITVGYVRRSHKIYGPPLSAIKGRKRYKESPITQETDIVEEERHFRR